MNDFLQRVRSMSREAKFNSLAAIDEDAGGEQAKKEEKAWMLDYFSEGYIKEQIIDSARKGWDFTHIEVYMNASGRVPHFWPEVSSQIMRIAENLGVKAREDVGRKTRDGASPICSGKIELSWSTPEQSAFGQ